jgi:hypothetical protein
MINRITTQVSGLKTNKKRHRMSSATKTLNLPSLTADLLGQTNLKIDNMFSSTWKSIGFNIMLRQAKFSKRSGTPVSDVTYLLMLWVWLKVNSLLPCFQGMHY